MNEDQQTQTTSQQDDTTSQDQDIQALKVELENMTAMAKRALADLQNFQKRSQEERLILYPQAQADLLLMFIPVISSFHLAFQNVPTELAEHNWTQGIAQIKQQFDQIIEKIGITEINPENQPFNPLEHEAMMEVEGPKGQIVQVFEKGYKLKDKVIRPAKVGVGR